MEEEKKKKWISVDDALLKLQRYCAYQDRCHQEVRHKLLDLGIYGDDLDHIMVELIQENFLNEERFARSFARGKFRMKQWGRNRILRELKQRDISEYCKRKAMEEIDEEAYMKTLYDLAEKRLDTTAAKDTFELRGKVAAYIINRGFETELTWEVIKELRPL